MLIVPEGKPHGAGTGRPPLGWESSEIIKSHCSFKKGIMPPRHQTLDLSTIEKRSFR